MMQATVGDTAIPFTNDKKLFGSSYPAQRNLGNADILSHITQANPLKQTGIIVDEFIVSLFCIFLEHFPDPLHKACRGHCK